MPDGELAGITAVAEPKTGTESPGEAQVSEVTDEEGAPSEEGPEDFETWFATHKADAKVAKFYEDHVEGLRRDTQGKTQKQLQPLYEASARKLGEYKTLAESAANSLMGIQQRIDRAVKDGSLDGDAATQLASSLLGVYQLNDLSHREGKIQGSIGFTKLLSRWAEIPDEGVKGLVEHWDAVRAGLEPEETAVYAILAATFKAKEDAAENRGFKRGIKEARKGGAEVTKAGERKGGGLDMSGGTGRSRSDAELLSNPNTPIEKIFEIRARQRSGL